MAAETGKQRQSRIELTYYRRPDALARRRRSLAALAVLAAAGWLILAPTFDARRRPSLGLFQWDRMASPGALAHPHAAWTDRCEVCHPSFAPINDARWSPLPAAVNSRTPDALCSACHAAPDHHPTTTLAADRTACAECHRDHKGPDAPIARPPDAACTTCHADLATHRRAGPATFANRVTAFDATNHPEFAALRSGATDPGHIKFNHALHLAPGLTLEPHGRPFTADRLAADDQARYAVTGSNDAVQLDCRSCHQLDDNDVGSTAPGTGAYMQPISYEQHCAACHPLAFEPERRDRRVSHGQPPAAVVEELRGFYAQAALDVDEQLLKRYVPDPDRRLPGKPDDPRGRTAGAALEAKLTTALRRFFGTSPGTAEGKQSGCLECHELTKPPAVPPRSIENYAALTLAASGIPAVWFRHAVFDHSAHRAMACTDCHAAAAGSRSHSDILLPDRASCTACHAPARMTSGGDPALPAGGVDFRCTECHRYHGPEHGQGLTRPAGANFADSPGPVSQVPPP